MFVSVELQHCDVTSCSLVEVYEVVEEHGNCTVKQNYEGVLRRP
jgi:hypothetical protein